MYTLLDTNKKTNKKDIQTMLVITIRALNVGLVVVCILVVATLCTSLAVWSGDTALSDTQTSRDTSVKAAFDSSQIAMSKVVEDYLNQHATSTVRQLVSRYEVPQLALENVCRSMNTEPVEKVTSWEYIYSWRKPLYHMVVSNENYDGIGIVTKKHQTLQIMEARETYHNAPNEYHHILSVVNNGTDYDNVTGIPALYRSVRGDVPPDGHGDLYGYPGSWETSPNCVAEGVKASASKGADLDVPCVFPEYDVVSTYFGLFDFLPIGGSMYTPLLGIGVYCGVVAQCAYEDSLTGERLGMLYVGMDLGKVSTFLQSLDLGVGSMGRIFAMVRRDMFASPLGNQTGYLAGTSHGNPFERIEDDSVNGYSFNPQHVSKCSDTLISGTGVHLLGPAVNDTSITLAEQLFLKGGAPEYYMLNTTRAPEGERFYVKVSVFNNNVGVNWYVVALIDREYVLGEVDAQNEATQRDIAASEDEVEEELEKARLMVYLVVVIVALIPIGLTVILVFRITKPLIQLMQDMSHVAVMDLEGVDSGRPLSSLAEVRAMERSFKQMMNNLVEYKQYLPQSILVETATEVEVQQVGEAVPVAVATNSSLRSSTTGSRQTSAAGAQTIFGHALRLKQVSVLVANLHKTNTITHYSALNEVLEKYLEVIIEGSRKFRGIVDDVSGDRATVSFNTTLPSTSCRTKSAETAMFIHENLNLESSKMNCAISAGKAICGTMGCTGMKKYGIVGVISTNVRSIERVGRHWGVSILSDGEVASEARTLFTMLSLRKVYLTGGKMTMLNELVSRRSESTNQEWMYQLQESDDKDPSAAYNEAVRYAYLALVQDAQNALNNCQDAPRIDLLKSLIHEVQRTGEPPLPVSMCTYPSLVGK